MDNRRFPLVREEFRACLNKSSPLRGLVLSRGAFPRTALMDHVTPVTWVQLFRRRCLVKAAMMFAVKKTHTAEFHPHSDPSHKDSVAVRN